MRILVLVIVLLLISAACNNEKKPDIVFRVATDPPTLEPHVTVIIVTATSSQDVIKTPADSEFHNSATPATPTTQAASATPRLEIFPTNTVSEVQLAETVFEHGRMFWIRHTRQIWVMVASPDDPHRGDWFCYNDTFEEGEMELDPALISPEGMYQPIRGFGKLWRNHPELREVLGWALIPEFELTSPYTYIPGGYVQGNQYFPGPGEHRLNTLDAQTISFYEGNIRGDCQGGTWRLN